eukprot:267423_1
MADITLKEYFLTLFLGVFFAEPILITFTKRCMAKKHTDLEGLIETKAVITHKAMTKQKIFYFDINFMVKSYDNSCKTNNYSSLITYKYYLIESRIFVYETKQFNKYNDNSTIRIMYNSSNTRHHILKPHYEYNKYNDQFPCCEPIIVNLMYKSIEIICEIFVYVAGWTISLVVGYIVIDGWIGLLFTVMHGIMMVILYILYQYCCKKSRKHYDPMLYKETLVNEQQYDMFEKKLNEIGINTYRNKYYQTK